MALLISAVQSALFNCHCEVPIFVECGDKYRHMYNGRLLAAGSMTELQVAHFSRGYERRHHEVSNLTTLLTIFKSKCRTPLEGPALLSIRLSYTIPTVMPKSVQSPLGHYCSLPWGARAPPIEAIKVCATWPVVTEDLVDDALEYTDLDATQAPQWSVQLQFNHTTKTGLARTIHKLLKIWNMDRTQEYYLDQVPSFDDDGVTMGGAFDQLTQSDAQKHFSVLTNTLSINTDNVPVTGAFAQIKDEIDATIESIFQPDEYTVGSSTTEVEDELDSMKSTPKGSILRKLAISLLHQLGQRDHVELRFAYLWARFVRHLRKRHIDQGQPITGVTAPQPQLQFCLAQQKLEMINYCIKASKSRDDRHFAEKSLPGLDLAPNQADSDNDEFFDCDSSAEQIDYDDNVGVDKATSMSLLKHPERKINIPKLQPNPPTTEDMLIKREREMTRLGSGEEGRKARLKMQQRLLEMDMGAFKAANKGATFEDFVRWHSPTDWSEHEGLSQRMTLPGNVWVELWAETTAQAAVNQPRLFDDTQELEQIMSDFSSGMTLGRIVEFLLPVLIHEGLRATIRNITGNEKIDNGDLLRMVPTKVAIESSQMNTMSYQSIEQLAEIIEQIETFDSRFLKN